MWQGNWRERVWSNLGQPHDLIIVGGGITGAGILREATKLGLKALLVDKRDFGWGTSSRSSKLVHGGLRYLKSGKIGLTRSSVLERERLMGEAPGLIDPLGFLLANYSGDSPGRWTFAAGLSVYDLLALNWSHQYYSTQDFQMLAPHLTSEGLRGGFRYGDAQTDDARLVLRVLQEAVIDGGSAINYVKADKLIRNEDGQVIGVQLHDVVDGRSAKVKARVTINATGAWADSLRQELGAEARIRPLRGSHLIFPAWRLPVAQAISFLHPIDRRPVFVFPWEGITLVGTTDVDHRSDLDAEPCVSPEEISYLMAAVQSQFSPLDLQVVDILATFAGIRPVIDTGKDDPSKESRDHVIWQESGLLTVTGGKLTTFRLIALDVIDRVRDLLPGIPPADTSDPVLNKDLPTLPERVDLKEDIRRRLLGRYGSFAAQLVNTAEPSELDPIPGTSTLWAELRWAARAEAVIHLDDLLLRRVRLGLLIPDGGRHQMANFRAVCQEELGWDDGRWSAEETAYLNIWQECYAPPLPDTIPEWHSAVAAARAKQGLLQQQRSVRRKGTAIALGAVAVVLTWAYIHSQRRIRSKDIAA